MPIPSGHHSAGCPVHQLVHLFQLSPLHLTPKAPPSSQQSCRLCRCFPTQRYWRSHTHLNGPGKAWTPLDCKAATLGCFFWRGGFILLFFSPPPAPVHLNEPTPHAKNGHVFPNCIDSFFFFHSLGVRPQGAGLTPGQSPLCLCFSLSHLCVLFWGAPPLPLQPGGSRQERGGGKWRDLAADPD